METSNNEVFKLIKNNNFIEIFNLIKNKKILNFDIKDENNNYFIHYLILYNQFEILNYIFNIKVTNIRIDFLDIDGRSILYNPIKYNNIDILKLILQYNNNNIGISIIDIKDKLGFTNLHYSVIFNNLNIFQILLKNNSNPNIKSNEGHNIFVYCIIYDRLPFLNYLIENNYNIYSVSNNNETLLQIATLYNNNVIINKLLKLNYNLNNQTFDYGIAIIHQSILYNNINLFTYLLKKNIDINITDFFGNTTLHYIIIEKYYNFFDDFIFIDNLNFNLSNINGDLPLHLLLINNDLHNININILNKFILETDLNIQNNQGITCLYYIITNNLTLKFKNILVNKPLNFFINNLNLNDTILDILIDSFYNQIINNKNELLLNWEKECAVNKNDKNKCKQIIKNIIQTEKRTLPKISNIELKLDEGIYTNFCSYSGISIDILFGLLFLYKEFKSLNLNLIINYPLTINNNLANYYKKIGINELYKLDFINIEIIWSYQKIFYPTYFDDEINNMIKNYNYLVIPIGIELSNGSHANILFWDVKNKTIERFEPNGSNYPIGLNYNPNLLDDLLYNKFKLFDNDIIYLKPKDFLPNIGFQYLENNETEKCKKLGDPNGFCGVWCIWWVYQRMLNINNDKYKNINIANELISFIKLYNKSFKLLIRNFSKKITNLRDSFLLKYKIDINDWIVQNYTSDILKNIEKDILIFINKI